MARSKRRSRTVQVSIHVPARLARRLPSVIDYRQPLSFGAPDRTARVPLRSRKEKTVLKKFKVRMPAKLPKQRAAYMMFRQGQLNIYGKKQTARTLITEPNRKRKDERKRNKKRGHANQLSSLRHDRLGIVSASVNRGASPSSVADAAMVARALKLWR